ncbi:MAG TPA: hypothetical protein ENH99_01715 [Candidatus Pacearchaeota archaeon]|nr:hypothetical protein [Candidatus Pacearchaeota archaeon]
MAKREIVEGLREAVGRGESLKNAMMSFFNSGYTKKDVEDAAKEAQKPQPIFQPVVQPGMPGQPIQPKPIPQVQQPSPQIQQPIFQQPQFRPLPQFPVQAIQTVSSYGQKQKSASLAIIIMLVFSLLFLMGLLAAVFFFKGEIIRFLSSGFLSFLY